VLHTVEDEMHVEVDYELSYFFSFFCMDVGSDGLIMTKVVVEVDQVHILW